MFLGSKEYFLHNLWVVKYVNWYERVCHYVPGFDQVCSCSISILSMYNWDSTQISVRADWWLICLRMLRWMLRMQDSGWRGRGQPRQPRYGLGTDIWHVTMLHGSVTAASPAADTAPQFWHRYIFSFYLPSPGWKWIVNPRFKNLIIRRLFAIMEVQTSCLHILWSEPAPKGSFVGRDL